MSGFDLLHNGLPTRLNALHNRSPRNRLHASTAMPWLYLALIMLSMLALYGCTRTIPQRVAVVSGITGSRLTMKQPGATAWPAPQIEDEGAPPHDLWERLRRGFLLPEPASEAVAPQAARIAESGLPQRVCARAAPLLYLLMDEVQRRQLPMELVLLPFVESSFQPQARSPVGAHGPWQFMPATAREQGLAINRVHDDRRAWLKATRAALDFLQRLHARFGDWYLTMAAYNAGPGRVEQALYRHGGRARFDELSSLPLETRQYVVQIFAWRALLSAPQRFGVTLPRTPNIPLLEEVPLAQDLDINLAAHLAGLSETRFRQWNPAFAGPLIAGATRPVLLLPGESARRFKRGIADWRKRRQPLAHWGLKRLERAATAAELARQWRLDASALLDANPLAAGRRYQAGSMLFVPRRFLAQPSAADIRYAALNSEPIPRPIKAQHRSPIQTRAVRVNYASKPVRAARSGRGGI